MEKLANRYGAGPWKSRTLKVWVLSYVIMFSLPLLFGAGIYGYSIRNTRKQTDELQYQSLKQIRTTVENILYNCSYPAQSLCLDSGAKALASFGTEYGLSVHQSMKSKELQAVMNLYAYSSEIIDKIYLYFPDTGYLLLPSKFNTIEAFRPVEHTELGMSIEKIVSLADRACNGFHIINQAPVYSYASPLNGGSHAAVLAVVYLKRSRLAEVLQAANQDIFLECADGSLFSPNGIHPEDSWLAMESKDSGDYAVMEQDGHVIMKLSGQAGPTGFYSIHSEEIYLKEIRVLVAILWIYVILTLLTGSCLAFFISRRNYRPVAELLILASKSSKAGLFTKRNDFSVIRDSYQALLSAYQNNSRKLKEQQEDKINHWFNRLLKDKNTPAEQIFRENAGWAESMTEDAYVLMSVEITDFASMDGEGNGETAEISSEVVDMAYFIVRNCLDELLNKEYTACIAETDGKLYGLINASETENPAGLNVFLKQCGRQLQDFIRTHYGMLLCIHISSPRIGAENISLCYQDIENLLIYRNYGDIPEETVLSAMEEEETGETEKQNNAKALSHRLYYFLMADETDKAEELLLRIRGKTAARPAKIDASTTPDDVGALMDRISEYIRSHYQDPLLSVGVIAEEFNLGLSYLSRYYKEKKGSGILESINRLRLEKAKELIASGVSIKETAEQVGFYNTQPLIRIFKQIEKMTPSEYRSLYMQKQAP